ncbi:MAG: hypothetical protein F4X51_06730 [Gemmatimonadetes bacterium]|nr:hypothetical protein [Gemmatimonadota bacterium]
MVADTELRKQHQRDAILRDRMRKAFDMAYDTDAALIVRWNPFFPRFNGHTVAQQSLDYAILLLLSDDRTYGTDDAGEANRIIRRILDHQDLRPKSETFGNFFWMTHWDRVKDKNAVSFGAQPDARWISGGCCRKGLPGRCAERFNRGCFVCPR